MDAFFHFVACPANTLQLRLNAAPTVLIDYFLPSDKCGLQFIILVSLLVDVSLKTADCRGYSLKPSSFPPAIPLDFMTRVKDC